LFKDMDIVFAVAYREGISPVRVAERDDLPIAGSSEADELLGIDVAQRQRKDAL
jgi:hypothetical protein